MPDQSVAGSIADTTKSTPLDGNIISTKSKLTESKSLASEAKDLLNRIGVSGVGRRCAEYRPSLDELKSASFSDYIRGELLGVPLPGYEFLYIYEDKEGRERKREVPIGQISPLLAETGDNAQLPPPFKGHAGLDPLKKAEQSMRTRSQSKAIEILKKGSKVVPPKAYLHRPKKYQMCWFKLRDGIAKISLPTGFWAKVDTTARGRHWAKGSKLGDTVIPSPIKQALSGIGGVYEYTLLEQPPVVVAQFRTQADEYRKRHIGKEFDEDHSDEFCDDLARKFWRRLGPTMEPATYGADMEGTLFKDAHACGWNVDRLESCLCLLRAHAKEGDRDDEVFHLPGVTSAYLYFGMWASAFAAHTEDMNLLSINYLHAGSPKYWYAIAQEDSKRFESLARSHFAGPASECHEFLRHKRCLLSPAILRKAGIKFTTCVQRPGDAIITFPGSYHFGFNTGFNIAESTNFAVPEWIPLGEAADICMCHPHSVRIQMKRLKSLLDSYENDMCYRESMGLPPLTYSIWAKHEAKRIKKEVRVCANKKVLGNGDHGYNPLKLPTALNASIAIEIRKESVTPKKKSKRKSFVRQEFNEWRIAKRVRPGLLVPATQVLCMVECEDVDAPSFDHDCEFFIGTIVKLVDGYVKVHLIGLGKKNDLWYEQDSDYLFLDCGLTDSPASDRENFENICKTARNMAQQRKKSCR
mmetsp:Transcript_12157/g.26515  ORF Transcript_12157/g.26515 Transcript_12157/m.26515 type:complete len:695 (-) Transcript_12157:213-2297(-)|eukprot:CAMPEP_0172299844 /NCGR_PEP_ID=MMETSP1058-20130122/2040_1 /TAXON_ID=83371 /ORGANISM="Detonula confervacea, Strain CCMP 353" /LENGTH=694 /DNA_ID=CAMNT_0013009415 /DNA_START=78 /DNA_END=2162 /DNA_ORIENTATION=-